MSDPRILIVDESASIRKTLQTRLQKISSDIQFARDGLSGMHKANEMKFDLILSDVEMDNMTGLEMCKELKKSKKTRSVPIILLSALDSDTDIDRGFEAGASAYLSKSSSVSQLRTTIGEVLQKAALNRGATIMVVDDSKTILRLVEASLESAGFNVMKAENGMEALAVLKTQRPDIIISDLDMPEMDGQEFCGHLKKSEEFRDVPFMIMSANNERSTMRAMIEKGASAYIVKPFNMEQLIITVEKMLSEQFQLLYHERLRLNFERESMLTSIATMIHALEARDPYTKGHSERVSEFAVGTGKIMGLNEEELDKLAMGGKLHDLGKIGVPDNVLLKHGKLTDIEYNIIKKHPVIGSEILQAIPSIQRVMPIVLHHHERIDGGGYPDGLSGEDIPLIARITGVADTYDAITSSRPYRDGLNQSKAIEIISSVRDTQLCGVCIDAFYEFMGV
ncbi:MAG: response regulator [Proteobacteria bacterium]|nr:response regulator [Pseudomonadota bacterium]